tara:strand:- start:1093 stop:2265 length:1173 start_codon:yes stop_codon:yes gene_type:complete
MNIIYIVFAPIPIHYANYLNIQNFKKNGFDVHICDVSSFFYSEEQTKAYFSTTAQFYKPSFEKVTFIKNFEQLSNYLNNFDNSNSIIYYTGRSFYKRYKENKIFELIYSYKYKIILSEFATEFFPISFLEKLKFKIFLLRNKILFRKYNNLYFIGSGKNIENISKKIFNQTLKYFSVPHPNYIWSQNANDANVTVYVEESLDGAPDNNTRKAVGGKFKGQTLGRTDFLDDSSINSKIFYENLNDFFLKFENKFKTKILIAASGKFVYHENPFKSRDIKYGDTINLINKSKYVIGHSSMALWQSIISKKKLILLVDDHLSLYKKLEIKNLSKKINSKIFYLSKNNQIKSNYINDLENNYSQEINFFLNSSKYKKNFQEIMLDVINMIIKDR